MILPDSWLKTKMQTERKREEETIDLNINLTISWEFAPTYLFDKAKQLKHYCIWSAITSVMSTWSRFDVGQKRRIAELSCSENPPKDGFPLFCLPCKAQERFRGAQ